MVEVGHTLVAGAAVLRAVPRGLYAAQVAVAFLYDVGVFAAVEGLQGHRAEASQCRFGGVNEDGAEVRRQVEQQQRGEEGEQSWLPLGRQRRHQQDVGPGGQDDEH